MHRADHTDAPVLAVVPACLRNPQDTEMLHLLRLSGATPFARAANAGLAIAA